MAVAVAVAVAAVAAVALSAAAAAAAAVAGGKRGEVGRGEARWGMRFGLVCRE